MANAVLVEERGEVALGHVVLERAVAEHAHGLVGGAGALCHLVIPTVIRSMCILPFSAARA